MTSKSRAFLRPLTSLAVLASAFSLAAPAQADDPVLRHQEDLHGDVLSIGSTMAFGHWAVTIASSKLVGCRCNLEPPFTPMVSG